VIVSNTAVLAALIVWVGIDVFKKWLDAAIWRGGKKYTTARVANDPDGYASLLEWARKAGGENAELRFCMESTGDYGVASAMYLTDLGFHVSVVNPARIEFFGAEQGRLTKTDKADAKLIAQFTCERDPRAWPMKSKAHRELFRLTRRRGQLKEMISMERCRRECPLAIGESCMSSTKTMLKAMRAELREIENKLNDLIEAASELKAKAELIRSIPGLQKATVFTILAEMPPVEEVASAASYAAAAGVQPTSSLNQPESAPMSRSGRRKVRQVFFQPILDARHKIPELGAFYDRLKLKGKKHRQVMVA
jgi:transposase